MVKWILAVTNFSDLRHKQLAAVILITHNF